jgi:hypothetical protein
MQEQPPQQINFHLYTTSSDIAEYKGAFALFDVMCKQVKMVLLWWTNDLFFSSSLFTISIDLNSYWES